MKSFTLGTDKNGAATAAPDSIDVISSDENADIFVFSSEISYNSGESLIDTVTEHRTRENVILVLATYGGDPHAAYRIARFLQDHYKRFSLYVYGFCKSAGTLLALGAHNIVMGDRAEFGPLDVQLHKPDEFMHRVSGLDITKALASISTSAWNAFEEFFIQVRARSGGVITTKTASEIAAQVVTGLFSPITQNIDPLKLGEMQRSMDIAADYGVRLGASAQLATALASTYPTHGFVIDFAEARRLFNCVRAPKEPEIQLAIQLTKFFCDTLDEDVIRHPSDEGVIAYLKPTPTKPTKTDEHQSTGNQGNPPSNATTTPDAPATPESAGDRPKATKRKRKQKEARPSA